MKIRELIDQLLELPPDDEIGVVEKVYAGECECCGVRYHYDFEPLRYVEPYSAGGWAVTT